MAIQVEGIVQVATNFLPGLVGYKSDLKVKIEGCRYDIGGLRGEYAGSVEQTMTGSATNYLYLDKTGAFQKNTTGFPTTALHVPLAEVVTSATIISAIHDRRVFIVASTGLEGTCRVQYPVDAGIRGGTTSASANNDIAAVRFDAASDGWNRWNGRPPQNRKSGDLTLRLYCSVAATVGSNKNTRWKLEWSYLDLDAALPASWSYSHEHTLNMSNQAADTLFDLDFTIAGASFDDTADLMVFKVSRLGTHADDTCPEHIYVHVQELRYAGFLLAGQSGQ